MTPKFHQVVLNRSTFIQKIDAAFKIHSVCAILGPRQCGKTTLAHLYTQQNPNPIHFFDLEHPNDLNALSSPSLALEPLNGTIVIDEIQRRPDLFPYLRHLSDYSDKKFLILGSASRDLIQQSSESLAGRISYIELTPLSLKEAAGDLHTHWIRGGFPKSYLAQEDKTSEEWRLNYIKTFLEQDLFMLGLSISPTVMQRLWTMLAHYHGQIVNYSELGQSLDLSDKSIKRYIDILQGTFMVRLLQPWYTNVGKRLVKRPKIYIRDSGLFHSLLNITRDTLITNPKVGASWEGYALEEVIRTLDLRQDTYFWRTEKGDELDLLYWDGPDCYGFEFKYSDAPQMTKSMHTAKNDLNLKQLTIITPGKRHYRLEENVKIVGLEAFIAS